jgi:uncharacterized protein
MPMDELKQPLRRRSLFERLWSRRPGPVVVAYMLTATLFSGAWLWASRIPHPFAGEPVVVALIPPAEDISTASTDVADQNSSNVSEVPQTKQAPDPPADEQAIPEALPNDPAAMESPAEPAANTQEAVVVISSRRGLTPAPAEGFVEITQQGALPKIGTGTKTPAQIYARAVSLNVIHSDAPKIAIVLGGMGLNASLTARAIRDLPPDVTLAFAPYGNDLQSQVNTARREGHEVMLQVPLEPVGFPASNPGPKTLLADGDKGENTDSLHWHMTRFTGYVGLINYMGGRFLASAPALTPLMAEMRKRGLLFVEDGSLPLSATSAVAKSTHAEARRANTVIDSDPTPQSIASSLQLLEQEAQTNGFAIGTGSGLEVTIDAVRDWAKDASDRGIVIIPVSAAFKGRLG